MAEQSIEHPMPSLVNADRVIDELYGGNPNQKIPKGKIEQAAAKAPIAPDVMTYFTHLENKSYSKQELIGALNAGVKARNREKEVGLFGVGYAEQEAERELGKQQKKA